MPTYTFYYSPYTHTVNGFTGYRLQTTQYTGNDVYGFMEFFPPVYFRYSIFIRRPDGTEITLGQNVATGQITSQGAYTTTFTPAQTNFPQNSAIRLVLTVYSGQIYSSINLITSQLTENNVSSTQWTLRAYFTFVEGKNYILPYLLFRESWVSGVDLYVGGEFYRNTSFCSLTEVYKLPLTSRATTINSDIAAFANTTKAPTGAFATKPKEFSFGSLIFTPPDYSIRDWAAKLLINNTSQNPVEVFISAPFNNLSTIVNKPGFLDRHGVKIGEVSSGQTKLIREEKYKYSLITLNVYGEFISPRFIFRCGSQVEIFDPGINPTVGVSGLSNRLRPVVYLRKSDTYKFNMMLEGCALILYPTGLEFDENENQKPVIRSFCNPQTGEVGSIGGFIGWDTDNPGNTTFQIRTDIPEEPDYGFFLWYSNHSYVRWDAAGSGSWVFTISNQRLHANGSPVYQIMYNIYPKMAFIPFNISGWDIFPEDPPAIYTFNQVEQSGFTKSHILLWSKDTWMFMSAFETGKFNYIVETEGGHPWRIYLKPGYSQGSIYTTAIKYENERPVGIELYFTQYVPGSKVRIQYVTPAPRFEPIPDTFIPGNSQGFELTINDNVVFHQFTWQGAYTEPVAVKITLFDSENHISFLIFKPAEVAITYDEYAGFGAFATKPPESNIGFGAFSAKEKSEAVGSGAFAARGGTGVIGAGGYAAREGSSSIGTGAFAAGTQMSVVGAGSFATKTKTANVNSGAFATKIKTVEIGSGAFATRLSISTIGTGAYTAKALSSQVGSGAFSARQRTFSVGTGAFATKRLSSQIGLGAYAIRGEETPKKKIIVSKLEVKPGFISKLKVGEVV